MGQIDDMRIDRSEIRMFHNGRSAMQVIALSTAEFGSAINFSRGAAQYFALCFHRTQSLFNVLDASRSHESRYFRSILQKYERRPQLHVEGATQPLPARIGDLDVANIRVSV